MAVALSSRLQLFLIVVSFSVVLFVIAFCCFGTPLRIDRPMFGEVRYGFSRKLLEQGVESGISTSKPSRSGEGCSTDDLVVYQGATTPLPNGIPTYTVQILNECISSCRIGDIHLSCHWFSSARLVNPKIFRRLRFDDCLVNDGRPIASGESISFQYANTFKYPLSVSSATCLP